MEYVLAGVAIAEFIFIVYQDWLNRQERERLQLKLMSKDTAEYKQAVEKTPEDTQSPINPYKPIEDVSIDKLMQAEDNI